MWASRMADPSGKWLVNFLLPAKKNGTRVADKGGVGLTLLYPVEERRHLILLLRHDFVLLRPIEV